MAEPGRYFDGVNALRGLAALMVVIHHAAYFAGLPVKLPFDIGSVGVMLFFVISGFVIGLNRHLPVGEFTARRALRIYPPYWAAYALSAAIVWGVAGKATGIAWYSPLLLPSFGYPTVFLPFWTLIFEVFFYALAAAVFSLRLSDRTLACCAILWILAIQHMSGYVTGKLQVMPGGLILFSPWNVFFAFGLLLALNIDMFRRAPIPLLLGVTVVATAVMGHQPSDVAGFLVMATALTAIVIAATQIERVPTSMMILGNASYGLFLLHYAPQEAASSLLATSSLDPVQRFLVLLAIGLAIGVLFGLAEYAFHRWALRALLRALGKSKKSPAYPA